MIKEPHEFPIFTRNGRRFSFLDCICEDVCKKQDCIYCAFDEILKGECPAQEPAN